MTRWRALRVIEKLYKVADRKTPNPFSAGYESDKETWHCPSKHTNLPNFSARKVLKVAE